MQLAWKGSRHKGTDLLLLLAIADNANDDGTLERWSPGIERLATKTRLDRSSVMRRLKVLEGSGELQIERRKGRPNLYTVNVELLENQSQNATSRKPRTRRTSATGDQSQNATTPSQDATGSEDADPSHPRHHTSGTGATTPVAPVRPVPSFPSSTSKPSGPSDRPAETRDRDDASGVVAHYVDAYRQHFAAEPTDTGELAKLAALELKAGWPVEACKRAAALAGGDQFGAKAFRKHLRQLRREQATSEPKGFAALRRLRSEEGRSA